jgi:hypothetical protein
MVADTIAINNISSSNEDIQQRATANRLAVALCIGLGPSVFIPFLLSVFIQVYLSTVTYNFVFSSTKIRYKPFGTFFP